MEQTIKLSNGISIPILGFGTWQITGDQARRAVKGAIGQGYRHIDTADAYGNHREVGQGIKESRIKRKDLFLTTKIWREHLHKDEVLEDAQRFLEELQTEYIDLLLVHWPNKNVPLDETLGTFNELLKKKVIRAVGVSNFTIPLLKDVIATNVPVVMNQVEFHPSLYQKELLEFCKKNKITITAYSPIAQGYDLKIPLVKELAKKYKKTESQIVLNWIMQKGIVVIPRSSKPEHAKDNLDALSFELEKNDMVKIDALGLHHRVVHPAFAPFKD